MRYHVSSIGRFLEPYCGARCKMAALPLPVAILDDLISGSRNWGHPRWRPEAEGPPFCTAHRNRARKNRPRSWMTSFPASPSWIQDGDDGNDVWRTSRRPWRRPTDVCPIHESCRSLTLLRFKKHLIVSLTQALSKWLSELPACYYAEVISLHMSKVVKKPSTSASSYSTFFFGFNFFIFLTVLYNSLELLYSTVS